MRGMFRSKLWMVGRWFLRLKSVKWKDLITGTSYLYLKEESKVKCVK